ncbi:MAG: helix-turn-helix domain-containing protein [Spirochaetia bacterium]|jgi:transcriptional regulator with XRE-family HTH domain|nr:helix-turn-helix domain-containing protein [Spirochaetia bacterium]
MTGSDIRKLLSQNIKYFREIRRLSQADLAYEANISIPFLSDIERGNKWPHPDTLASIATTLQVEPVDLFTPKYTTDSETKTLINRISRDLLLAHQQATERVLHRYITLNQD